ncbi:MAG: pyruvate, phosphate dikinase [Gammaproteobacteria bacterium]
MADKKKPSGIKHIYYFSREMSEGNRDMGEILGGKGANLAEMAAIGLPVPPGFTITTMTCASFFEAGQQLPDGLLQQIRKNIKRLERETGKQFGAVSRPLLISVRSGAAVSMPGMMDTVLNLGLTDHSLAGLIKETGNRRFAYDAYRRLINMFGNVVMGIDHEQFENVFDDIKKHYKAKHDTDLDEDSLAELIDEYKRVYKQHTKKDFPQDPYVQLEMAVAAVFRSWNIPRAITYRRINDINGLLGTAVNIQSMVFGNMGDDSATGVVFTRDPSTGKNKFYGEFLINAQGEDVVAGIRTPLPVAEMKKWRPRLYKQLLDIKQTLETHYREMQDIEFTIERSKLYILQTRTGKRTGAAAVKIAIDMVRERRISQKMALMRVDPDDLNQLLLPSFNKKARRRVLTTGLPASPGAATGYPVYSADEAVDRAKAGDSVILVRKETSPEDIHGMNAAEGILTSTGGTTSHAAVVARGWGKCCVAGATQIIINEKRKSMVINGYKITNNNMISIDGATGEVMLGDLPKQPPVFSKEFKILMQWADKIRKLGIRTNADTPEDAQQARNFGATGIGLCRTEHMFFGDARISAMRRMILSENEEDRRIALKTLLSYQRKDFAGIFKAMRGMPVTIRLIDPPLHEFLPQDRKSQQQAAKAMGVPAGKIKRRVEQLHEINPMLGHRGCRLIISHPEILEMQVTAIVEAAILCRKQYIKAMPEIMIPLVGIDHELALLRQLVEETILNVKRRKKFRGKLEIPIGTMIEVPRAALTADRIAEHADFFSFGTNDLTQMTLGFSRDDISSFLPEYLEKNILEKNPFQTLDTWGVGQLLNTAVQKGRSTKRDLKCGICGEHGGDPESIQFFASVNLDYISCSPFRVPVARLAAAQAVLIG